MLGLLDWVKIGAGAALGALVASGPLYMLGTHNGRQQAALAALEKSVEVLQARNKIDDEISAADASRLCTDFGLSDSEASECVRRLEQAASQP